MKKNQNEKAKDSKITEEQKSFFQKKKFRSQGPKCTTNQVPGRN